PAGKVQPRSRHDCRMAPSPRPKNDAKRRRLVKYETTRTSAGTWRISASSSTRTVKETTAMCQAGLRSGGRASVSLMRVSVHVDGAPVDRVEDQLLVPVQGRMLARVRGGIERGAADHEDDSGAPVAVEEQG